MKAFAICLPTPGSAVVAETAAVPARAPPPSRCASAGADVPDAVKARRGAGPGNPVSGTAVADLNGLPRAAAVAVRGSAGTDTATDVVGAPAAVCGPLPSSSVCSMIAKGRLFAESPERPAASTARNTPGVIRFADMGWLPRSLEAFAAVVATMPLCPAGRPESSRGILYSPADGAGLLVAGVSEVDSTTAAGLDG